jgi:hypothetical protein
MQRSDSAKEIPTQRKFSGKSKQENSRKMLLTPVRKSKQRNSSRRFHQSPQRNEKSEE